MDVAAAYLFAGQEDINGTAPQALPGGAAQRYFTDGQGYSPWAPNADEPARQQALDRALDGIIRMMSGVVPSLFAVLQAVIFLALGLAAAIILLSLPLTLVFAFFNATEVITLAVLRSYIGLLIKTFVISMALAIEMGFLIYWASQNNWLAFLGMSLVILFFTWQFVGLAAQTITGSLNVITQGIGAATGARLAVLDPPGLAAGAVRQGGGLAQTGRAGRGAAARARDRRPQPGPGRGGLRADRRGRRGAGGRHAGPDGAPGRRAGRRRAGAGDPWRADRLRRLHALGRAPGRSARRSGARGGRGRFADGRGRRPGPPTRGDECVFARAGHRAESALCHGAAPRRSRAKVRRPPAPDPTSAAAADATPLDDGAAPSLAVGRPVTDPSWRAVESPGLAQALAELPAAAQQEALPAPLRRLPARAQAALLRIGATYTPAGIAGAVGAVQAVAQGLRNRGDEAAIPASFLDANGRLALDSPGMQAVLQQPGAAAFAGGPERRRDLAYLAGARLGLQRAVPAAAIALAIGQAVEAGGDAHTAAETLELRRPRPGAAGTARCRASSTRPPRLA